MYHSHDYDHVHPSFLYIIYFDFSHFTFVCLNRIKYSIVLKLVLIIPPLPEGGGGYTVLPLSVCPSKIFFVTFFSVTVDGRNLIFGHKHHIGIPYCG